MEEPPIVDPAARIGYAGTTLTAQSVPAAPLALLKTWYADAVADARISEPNAMVVATVDAEGMPNARTVLLKRLDGEGFSFFTNTGSTKAAELQANPVACLVLLWHPMYRQVRVRGVVQPVERHLAEAYFATRPRDSQIAAWASRQSEPVDSRADVERAFADAHARFAGQAQVPMPPFWGGYLVRPTEVEFWVGQASRLHDRLVYASLDGAPARLDDPGAWTTRRRQP